MGRQRLQLDKSIEANSKKKHFRRSGRVIRFKESAFSKYFVVNKYEVVDERQHLEVLFKSKGSVWPRVLPNCLLNTTVAAILWYLVKFQYIHIQFCGNANSYMSALVSFLVVSRVLMIYGLREYARGRLATLCKCCEEISQNALLFTSYNDSSFARKWRDDLTYITILLLKHSMCALRRHSEIVNMSSSELSDDLMKRDSNIFQKPMRIAFMLKKKITKQRLDHELSGRMLSGGEESKIMGFIDEYTAAFLELEETALTVFPFPLLQMSRTILYLWLMLLPVQLVGEKYPLWGLCTMVFILTFGFLGLEKISIEMSDPFGADSTDFELSFMAETTFDHIYTMLYNVDGRHAAEDLIRKVRNPFIAMMFEYMDG